MNAFYFIFSRFKKLKSKKGFLSFNFYLSVCLITFSFIAIVLTDSYIPDPYQTIKFVIKKNTNTPKLILKKEFRIDTLASMNVPIKTHTAREK